MKKITATMFIVLICVIMQGCSVQKNEPTPYQSKMVYDQGGSTLYTIEPDSLVRGFLYNEVAAKQKYMGKRVAVKGRIGSIYSLSNGDPALMLWDGFSIFLVVCEFPKIFIDDIALMSGGQNVIVIGTVYDYVSTRKRNIVYLKDCIFAQPALF
jgi:hypothetical protein